MITRTEVLKAIADCEKHADRGALDVSLATEVQRGPLHVLIEAAKCARYECIGGSLGEPPSNSDVVLDYEPTPLSDAAINGELETVTNELTESRRHVAELERAMVDAEGILRRARND